jgi:hypothetical protein
VSVPEAIAAGIEPVVMVQGYRYLVDWGAGVYPRFHSVSKDKVCACDRGSSCSAVAAVRTHLLSGGQRAPDPPSHYYEAVPVHCPLCRAAAIPDPAWDSLKHGKGWRCVQGGLAHYLDARMAHARQWFFREWIIPPAENYPGVRALQRA